MIVVFRPLAETLDTSRSNFESSRSRRQLFEKGICEQFRQILLQSFAAPLRLGGGDFLIYGRQFKFARHGLTFPLLSHFYCPYHSL